MKGLLEAITPELIEILTEISKEKLKGASWCDPKYLRHNLSNAALELCETALDEFGIDLLELNDDDIAVALTFTGLSDSQQAEICADYLKLVGRTLNLNAVVLSLLISLRIDSRVDLLDLSDDTLRDLWFLASANLKFNIDVMQNLKNNINQL